MLTLALIVALFSSQPGDLGSTKGIYGARCLADSELLGHEVPGYVDDDHIIVNEYLFALATPAEPRIVVGHAYSTKSAGIFFVGSDTGYRKHLVTLAPVSTVHRKSAPGSAKLLEEMAPYVRGTPVYFIAARDHSCFRQ